MTRRLGDAHLPGGPGGVLGAAERGENDGEHPPKPPNADVAWEAATLCSKAIGQLLDFNKTGVITDFSADPSPESQLEASALIDAVHEDGE